MRYIYTYSVYKLGGSWPGVVNCCWRTGWSAGGERLHGASHDSLWFSSSYPSLVTQVSAGPQARHADPASARGPPRTPGDGTALPRAAAGGAGGRAGARGKKERREQPVPAIPVPSGAVLGGRNGSCCGKRPPGWCCCSSAEPEPRDALPAGQAPSPLSGAPHPRPRPAPGVRSKLSDMLRPGGSGAHGREERSGAGRGERAGGARARPGPALSLSPPRSAAMAAPAPSPRQPGNGVSKGTAFPAPASPR